MWNESIRNKYMAPTSLSQGPLVGYLLTPGTYLADVGNFQAVPSLHQLSSSIESLQSHQSIGQGTGNLIGALLLGSLLSAPAICILCHIQTAMPVAFPLAPFLCGTAHNYPPLLFHTAHFSLQPGTWCSERRGMDVS